MRRSWTASAQSGTDESRDTRGLLGFGGGGGGGGGGGSGRQRATWRRWRAAPGCLGAGAAMAGPRRAELGQAMAMAMGVGVEVESVAENGIG
jgi:hypothetical protein